MESLAQNVLSNAAWALALALVASRVWRQRPVLAHGLWLLVLLKLVPPSFVDFQEQRDAVLIHELAHLKRRDHWVRRLEAVVLGLDWWNPVAWWARREIEKAEEECCNAWIV